MSSQAQKTVADAHKALAASKRKKEVNTKKAAAAAGQLAPSATTSGGKPSTTGHIAKGAAGGAAAGATLGSVVPGIGTGIGAAAGAVIGGAGGAVSGHKAKQEWKANKPGAGYKRALVAEFAICTIVLALSPLAKESTNARDWMKRGTALSAVFIILGFTSSFGPRAGKAAVGLGALITLALAIDQRSIFSAIADRLGKTEGEPTSSGPPIDISPAPAQPQAVIPTAIPIPRFTPSSGPQVLST